MDQAERELLETTVRDAVAVAGTDGDDVLRSLGWLEMLAAERRDAIDIVFATLGETGASATALDDVVATALGCDGGDPAVLLPPFARWDQPGTLDGTRVHGLGLTTARARSASELVVACRHEGETLRVVVPTAAVELTPVQGIDPDLGLSIARLDLLADDGASLDTASIGQDAWDRATADGRRAVAHQVAGACRTMLSLAREHAIERVQFGRPIARFQAVRHRLAEALVAVEALEASLAAAGDAPGPITAAAAKVVAGRTAGTVGAHCQQVLAGTGFTMEHDFHRFLKRTMALDGLFGSADAIALDLGRRLLAMRTVPTLIEL